MKWRKRHTTHIHTGMMGKANTYKNEGVIYVPFNTFSSGFCGLPDKIHTILYSYGLLFIYVTFNYFTHKKKLQSAM